MTSAVGVDGDDDFLPGEDTVEIRIPLATGAIRARVELLFQSVPPTMIEGLSDHPTPAFSRLAHMTEATPAAPNVLASVEAAP